MKKISAVLVALVVACAVVYGSDTVTQHSFSIPNGGGIEKIDGVHLTNVTWNGSAVTVVTLSVATNATATIVLTPQTAKGYIGDVAVTNALGAEMLFATNVTGVITVTPQTKSVKVIQ